MIADRASHAPRGEVATEALAPRALRELLRTPAFRELLALGTVASPPGQARATLRALLTEQAQVGLDLAGLGPTALDAAIESALALGEYLADLPSPLADAFLDELIAQLDAEGLARLPALWAPLVARTLLPHIVPALTAATAALADSLADLDEAERQALLLRLAQGLDGARIGHSVNALARLVRQLEASRGDLAPARRLAAELLDTVDLGQLRLAATDASALGRDLLVSLLGEALDDPVALANLVVTLPPLVNDQLALLETALDRLDLPDEMLASTTATVLADLHLEALGRVLSRLASLLGALHDGSKVLTPTEPALATAAEAALDRLTATLDGPALAKAALALGEDGEMIFTLLARLVGREPSLLPGVIVALAEAAAPASRGLAALLQAINALPDDAMAQLAGRLAAATRAADLDRLASELLTLAARCQRAGVPRAAGRPLVAAILDHPEVSRALEPERVGRAISALLLSFGHALAERPDGARRYVTRVVTAIDPEALELAWQGALDLAASALRGGGQQARALIRPTFRATWRGLRDAARQGALRLGPRGGARP